MHVFCSERIAAILTTFPLWIQKWVIHFRALNCFSARRFERESDGVSFQSFPLKAWPFERGRRVLCIDAEIVFQIHAKPVLRLWTRLLNIPASQIFPMVTDEEISCTIEQVFYLRVDPNRRFQPEKNVKTPFIIPYPSFIYVNIPRFAGFLRKHPNNGLFFSPGWISSISRWTFTTVLTSRVDSTFNMPCWGTWP